jgi:hypothetical protein
MIRARSESPASSFTPVHMKDMLVKLFLGLGPADEIPAQGPHRVFQLIVEEWNAPTSYGVLRIVSLMLVLTALFVPETYIDWMLSRRKDKVDARIIAISREVLYVLRFAVWFVILKTGVWKHTLGVLLVAYLIAGITRHLFGGVLAWGRHSIDPTRSVLWALVNYAELVLGFAGLYLHCDCLNVKLTGLTQAVYFSAVTAATVGYGDMYPISASGQGLVIVQIGLSFLLVAFVLSVLLSRVPREARKS